MNEMKYLRNKVKMESSLPIFLCLLILLRMIIFAPPSGMLAQLV